jgi:aryl-alcohol dehydrogenase-like predicted oxidoreductase
MFATIARAALAGTLWRAGIELPIIRARKIEQLEDNL